MTEQSTGKVKPAQTSRPTVSHGSTLEERKELLEMCKQVGALILAQRHDKVNPAVDMLHQRATGLLLKQHLDVWLPRYQDHIASLERVFGKGLNIDKANLVNDLCAKVEKAGYPSMKEFVIKTLMPVLTYNGLLLFLNNDAKVGLPADVREEFGDRATKLRFIIGGACAAMALQEAMGI